MSLPLHTVATVHGTTFALQDRVFVGVIPGLANGAGGGAGQAVTVAVTGLQLPAKYSVSLTPDQDAVCYVSSKTSTGFTINLNPRLAANTLASGKVDVTIVA